MLGKSLTPTPLGFMQGILPNGKWKVTGGMQTQTLPSGAQAGLVSLPSVQQLMTWVWSPSAKPPEAETLFLLRC